MAEFPVIGLFSPLDEKQIFFPPTGCSSIQVTMKRTYGGTLHTQEVFKGKAFLGVRPSAVDTGWLTFLLSGYQAPFSARHHGRRQGKAEPKMKQEEGRLRGQERVRAPHVQEALKIHGKEDVGGRGDHRMKATQRIPGRRAGSGSWK